MNLLHRCQQPVLVLGSSRLQLLVQLLPWQAQQPIWSVLMQVPTLQRPQWSIIWERQPGRAASLRLPLWLQLPEQEASVLFWLPLLLPAGQPQGCSVRAEQQLSQQLPSLWLPWP